METNLKGEYQINNSNLLKSEGLPLRLVIGSRKKPTGKKPLHFILEHLESGKYIFLSSLFPCSNEAKNDQESYSMDYKGLNYLLTIDREANNAKIEVLGRKGENSLSSIINSELGSKYHPKW
jgi:hypothetical protein